MRSDGEAAARANDKELSVNHCFLAKMGDKRNKRKDSSVCNSLSIGFVNDLERVNFRYALGGQN